jgi:hypothetical protein
MLENLVIRSRRYPCRVGDFYKTLSEADKEILMANLTNDAISHNALSSALKTVGVVIADTSIARHRQGLCSCSRI